MEENRRKGEGGGEQDRPLCVNLARCRGTQAIAIMYMSLATVLTVPTVSYHFIYTILCVVYFDPCRTWQ